jgi:hypothetical protein
MQTRNRSEAWRPLAFLPIEEFYYSKAQIKLMSTELKFQRFHLLCEAAFRSLRQAQQPGAMDRVSLQLGILMKEVNLKLPVGYIIGDTQGGDYVAGRPPYYNSTYAKRLTRVCDFGPNDLGHNGPDCCTRLIHADVKKLIEDKNQAALTALYQMPCKNWFLDLYFGESPQGLFSAACPAEPLHNLEKGPMVDSEKELFSLIGKKEKGLLDTIVKEWTTYPKQRQFSSSPAQFPRLSFKDGITNLSDLPAHTYVGIMLAIVVAALTRDGRHLFCKKCEQKIGPNKYRDMLTTFETLLCFWAWLKKEEYWVFDDSEVRMKEAQTAIGIMLDNLQSLWPRGKGQGWFTSKIHECNHYPFNIWLFGAVINFHSGPQENSHLFFVKDLFDRTQRRKKELNEQIANRIIDKYIVRDAKRIMDKSKAFVEESDEQELKRQMGNLQLDEESDEEGLNDETDPNGDFSLFIKNPKNGPTRVNWEWKNKSSKVEMDREVIEAVKKVLFDPLTKTKKMRGLNVTCYTLYKQKDKLYRTNPNFRNSGPWYDNVMVNWENPTDTTDDIGSISMSSESSNSSNSDASDSFAEENDSDATGTATKTSKLVPAHLVCFLRVDEGPLKAIVHSCYSKGHKQSVLTNLWMLEYAEHDRAVYPIFPESRDDESDDEDYGDDSFTMPQYEPDESDDELTPVYRLIDVESIERHCLLIPLHANSQYLMQIFDPEKWADLFY